MSAPSAPKKRAKKLSTEYETRTPQIGRDGAEVSATSPDAPDPAELTDTAGGIQPDGTFTPRIIGQEGSTPNPMVDVFSLDGGATYYRVPAEPNLAALVQFQADVETKGYARAAENLTTTLLGKDALHDLATSPKASKKDLGHVFAIVMRIGLEGVDRMKEEIRRLADPT